MSAIDRIMRAYSSKHSLNQVQSVLVRTELSAFITELMSGKRPEFPPVLVAEECAFIGRADQGALMKSLSEQHHVVEGVATRTFPVVTVKN